MNIFQRIICTLIGVKNANKKTFMSAFDEELERRVVKAYASGKSWVAMQKDFRLSASQVSSILRKHHVKRRNFRRKRNETF